MSRKELFVGNLGKDVNRKDIEDVFEKYGRLVRCDVKNKSFGASFCFLEFEDERDAEDALRGENGKDMDGSSMVVEWAKGKRDFRDSRGGGDRFGDRGGRDGGRGGGDRFGARDGGRDGYGSRGGGFGGRDGGAGRDTSSVECYQCHERGHFARNCPKGDGGRGGGDRGGERRYGGDRGGDRRDGGGRDRGRDSSRSRRNSRSKSRSRTPKHQSRSPRTRSPS